MLFLAPLFIAGLFAGKAMREQAAWKLYQRVCDARMRYISTERHYRYIKIRDWDDVAKQYQFGVADFFEQGRLSNAEKIFCMGGRRLRIPYEIKGMGH